MSSAVETNLAPATEMDAGNETLIFNVGGVIFETYRSTLMRMQSGPLRDDVFLKAAYRPTKNDYFFDRDPDAFKVLLIYLRTGQISIPTNIDGPLIKNELMFWGVTSELTSDSEMTFSGKSSKGLATTGQCLEPSEHGSQTGIGNKIWNLLSIPESSMFAMIYTGVSYLLMFLSVFILVAETTPFLQKGYTATGADDNVTTIYWYTPQTPKDYDVLIVAVIISLICCLFFTVEYIVRVIFAPNKKLFILSFLGVIDFLAILPNWLSFLIDLFGSGSSLRILRLLRFIRILRLLRIFKHFKVLFGTDVFLRTLKSCFGKIFGLFLFTFIIVLLWGSLAYAIDYEGEYGRLYYNIPSACWWVIVTMTTVGYGDIVPITVEGKVLGSLCALSGLLIIGLLVAIIVTSMVDISRKMIKTGERENVSCKTN